jgi:hypothetical protein
MNILLEVLNKFKSEVYIMNDNIKKDLTISEEERRKRSFDVLFLFEKVDAFLNEIDTNIKNGITELTINQRNQYFKKYNLNKNNIFYIKINMRIIKNRHYQQDTRDRKKVYHALFKLKHN